MIPKESLLTASDVTGKDHGIEVEDHEKPGVLGSQIFMKSGVINLCAPWSLDVEKSTFLMPPRYGIICNQILEL